MEIAISLMAKISLAKQLDLYAGLPLALQIGIEDAIRSKHGHDANEDTIFANFLVKRDLVATRVPIQTKTGREGVKIRPSSPLRAAPPPPICTLQT